MSNHYKNHEERMKIESTFWKNIGDEKEALKQNTPKLSDEQAHKILDTAMETIDKAIKEAEESKAKNERKKRMFAATAATILVLHFIAQAILIWRLW